MCVNNIHNIILQILNFVSRKNDTIPYYSDNYAVWSLYIMAPTDVCVVSKDYYVFFHVMGTIFVRVSNKSIVNVRFVYAHDQVVTRNWYSENMRNSITAINQNICSNI